MGIGLNKIVIEYKFDDYKISCENIEIIVIIIIIDFFAQIIIIIKIVIINHIKAAVKTSWGSKR